MWKIHNGTSEAGRLLEEYTYHPTEERVWVKKVYNSSNEVAETTVYISDTFIRVINSSGTYDFAYIKHEGMLVAQVAAGGNTEFIHGDHEGSSTVVTDSLGNAIENSSYEPFGALISGGTKTRFDYEGKEYDSLVRHYDFHARPYDPWLKQFVQPDTLLPNVYDPQQLNRYSFERNNPYNEVDPDGRQAEVVLGVAVAAGVALHYYFAYDDLIDLNDEKKNPDLEKRLIEKQGNILQAFTSLVGMIFGDEHSIAEGMSVDASFLNLEDDTKEVIEKNPDRYQTQCDNVYSACYEEPKIIKLLETIPPPFYWHSKKVSGGDNHMTKGGGGGGERTCNPPATRCSGSTPYGNYDVPEGATVYPEWFPNIPKPDPSPTPSKSNSG